MRLTISSVVGSAKLDFLTTGNRKSTNPRAIQGVRRAAFSGGSALAKEGYFFSRPAPVEKPRAPKFFHPPRLASLWTGAL
jgi:hypothetical protein